MKNKILVPFVGDSVGGSHKSILEVIDKLKEKNVNIILLLHKRNGPLEKFIKRKKIKFDFLEVNNLSGEKPSIINIFYTNLINFNKFRKYLKKENITLVHCNDLRTNLSWSVPALFSKIPLIWHQRTLISNSYWWKIIKIITSEYIVTSKTILKKSPSNLKNIKVIPNPIILQKNFKKKEYNKDIVKIGYCGRIVREKNIEHLLNSFFKLYKNNNKFKFQLNIAGRGEKDFINYLKGLTKTNNCTKNINFLGFVENSYNFIKNQDILICPSSIDGFGRTIIESMSVNTPVIAANAGGHKDLIQHNINGILYKPKDDDDLTLKIKNLIKNKILISKIVNNGKKYSNQFASEIIANNIFNIYKNLHKNDQFNDLVNILHIDIEGGWGGSSKSLFELVKLINNQISNSSIIFGQKGKIVNEYNKLGVPNDFIGNLFSFVPRKKNSLKILIKNSTKLLHFPLTLRKILKNIKKNNIEILHLNYEGLFLYGLFIKFLTNTKIIIHMRTLLPYKNYFSSIIIFLISKICADYVLFISKNENKRYLKSGNYKKIPGKILLNIFNSKKIIRKNYNKKKYTITYLGNISYNKGVDRLIDLAKYFKDQKNNDFLIRVYGVARDSKIFYENLLKNKKHLKLDNIEFKNHTQDITKILLDSFLLIRPSRDNDPWGRDVIEAVTLGLPVIATGTFNEIVKNRKNGFLLKEFKCQTIYNHCEFLKNNKAEWNNFRNYSIKNVRNKYVGNDQKIIFQKILKKMMK